MARTEPWLSGYSGYSGKSGFSGYSGDNPWSSGYSGFSGISGFSGYSGSGVSGYSGYSGSGTSGYSGFSGISGYSGYSGTSGFSGQVWQGYTERGAFELPYSIEQLSNNSSITIGSTKLAWQNFTPGEDMSLSTLSIKCEISTAYNLTANIYATNWSWFPTWSSLWSDTKASTGDITFTFGSPIALTSGVKYAFTISSSWPTTSSDYVRFQNTSVYAGGNALSSTDSGSSWSDLATYDLYFVLSEADASYSPYDVVTYLGSSYVNILASTTELPTNTTYWTLMASIGSSGYSGYSGTSGFSGYSGDNPWSSGYSGYSGISGFSGISGYSGFSGTTALRVSTETSSATPTINTDNVDAHSITAIATNITSFTTNLSGTPTNFQRLLIRIKDNATPRTIAWGASFEAKGVALPTTTTASKVTTVWFIYDTVTSKWGCVASVTEA